MQIVPFTDNYILAVKQFADREIGEGYYSVDELVMNQKRSVTAANDISSFLLLAEDEKVLGLRLAFPPGKWDHGKGQALRPDLWPHKLINTAYFQSLFLSKQVQAGGWGAKLSRKSIEIFKKIGALGIAAHCWKESPHNSSYKYLKKMGFNAIVEHPNYWINVDYACTRDGKPCHCTAIEMYLDLIKN